MNLALSLPQNLDTFRTALLKPDHTADQLAELERLLAAEDKWFGNLEDLHEQVWNLTEADESTSEVIESLWTGACFSMTLYQDLLRLTYQLARGRFRRRFRNEVGKRADRLAEFMRTMVVVWEEPELKCPPEIFEAVWTIRIAPLAYLRAMGNLFWSSIRHPLSETKIELKTGRVLSQM